MPDLFELLKSPRHEFDADEIRILFSSVSEQRVNTLSKLLVSDLAKNIPNLFNRRKKLADYRTNPYVLLATANVMDLSNPEKFADFLFNSKLAMGLETSFGKIIERAFVGGYPCDGEECWSDPIEKVAEFEAEKRAEGRQAKAVIRNNSIWREIDKGVVFSNRRYLTSIKSGPNTINDTQVQGMADAIATKYEAWWDQSVSSYPHLEGLDIVIGLTYGTEKSTNNKDNQILAKLLDRGFEELDQELHPGVLVDSKTGRVRVYRRIGQGFWSWIGSPAEETKYPQIFLEILLATTIALAEVFKEGSTIEEGVNLRLAALATALMKMRFSKDTLPSWVAEDVTDEQLFWFATAMSSFFDDGV